LFRAGRPRGTDGVWVALAALLAAVVLFHIVTPSAGPESRYLIAVAAPLLLFAAAGVVYLAEFLPRSMPFGARVAIPALLALAIFFAQRFEIPQKPHRGFRELAHDLLGREDDPVMLISSTSSGEGLLVSEVAMQAAHRFDHWVLRAGKVLAVSDWNADHYRPLQHSQAEVAAFLESIPVSLVVIDLDAPDPVVTHHQMLQDTLRARPERWRLLGRYPENAPTIDVYEMLGSEKTPRGKIRVDLPYTLGRPIER
jgi:hypothetical protein